MNHEGPHKRNAKGASSTKQIGSQESEVPWATAFIGVKMVCSEKVLKGFHGAFECY